MTSIIDARGAPPPLARARGRRFAALPSGPSREPQALLIQRLLSFQQYPSTTDSVSPFETGNWKLETGNRYPNHRTSAAVANRFNTAAGSSHFQPNSINWS